MGMPGYCKPLKLTHNKRTARSYKKLVSRLTRVYERAQLSSDMAMPQAEAQLYGKRKISVFRPFKFFPRKTSGNKAYLLHVVFVSLF